METVTLPIFNVNYSDDKLAKVLEGAIQNLTRKKITQATASLNDIVQIAPMSIVSGVALLYLGRIYATTASANDAYVTWNRALHILPLALIYDGLKKFLLVTHDSRWETLILLVVNKITGIEYEPHLGNARSTEWSDYGFTSYWDRYLTNTLLKKYHQSPNFMVAIGADGMQGVPIAWVRALNISEQEANQLHRIGQELKRLGDFESAKQTYFSVIAIRPDDNAGYYNLGKVFYLEHDIGKSITSYMRALHLEVVMAAVRHQLLKNDQSIMRLSDDAKCQLILSDPNTSTHLGHALAELLPSSLKDKSQHYVESYWLGLAGKGFSAIREENEKEYMVIGMRFALDNLDWSSIVSLDVTTQYTNVRGMSFNSVI
jgi:tetratricopeptide (TPR) repeat protein